MAHETRPKLWIRKKKKKGTQNPFNNLDLLEKALTLYKPLLTIACVNVMGKYFQQVALYLTSASGSKVTKMEMNTFPKSDFSSVKCKVNTRTGTSPDKPSPMNRNVEAHKVGSVRQSPTRINNESAESLC